MDGLDNICATYRHDFGLLPEKDQEIIRKALRPIYEHYVKPLEDASFLANQYVQERNRLRAELAQANATIAALAHVKVLQDKYKAMAVLLSESAGNGETRCLGCRTTGVHDRECPVEVAFFKPELLASQFIALRKKCKGLEDNVLEKGQRIADLKSRLEAAEACASAPTDESAKVSLETLDQVRERFGHVLKNSQRSRAKAEGGDLPEVRQACYLADIRRSLDVIAKAIASHGEQKGIEVGPCVIDMTCVGPYGTEIIVQCEGFRGNGNSFLQLLSAVSGRSDKKLAKGTTFTVFVERA